MFLQLRMFNYLAVSVVAAFCLLWIPLTLARSFDNSKNDVHDGVVGGPVKSNSNQFNPGSTAYFAAKRNLRSMLVSPKEFQQTKGHGKSPLSLDLADFLLEYDEEDRNKRFDDYGHMRFGKRGGEEQFDDYGHMRFGRSL